MQIRSTPSKDPNWYARFKVDPESENDVLLEDHPQMITHALIKAFKPFIDAINARVYTAYIIPDWYPLRLRREKWDGETGHAGKIYVVGSGWNRDLFTITFKDGYFNLRLDHPSKMNGKGRDRKFFAADPKSIQKIKDEIIDYYRTKMDEISLDDLPLG